MSTSTPRNAPSRSTRWTSRRASPRRQPARGSPRTRSRPAARRARAQAPPPRRRALPPARTDSWRRRRRARSRSRGRAASRPARTWNPAGVSDDVAAEVGDHPARDVDVGPADERALDLDVEIGVGEAGRHQQRREVLARLIAAHADAAATQPAAADRQRRTPRRACRRRRPARAGRRPAPGSAASPSRRRRPASPRRRRARRSPRGTAPSCRCCRRTAVRRAHAVARGRRARSASRAGVLDVDPQRVNAARMCRVSSLSSAPVSRVSPSASAASTRARLVMLFDSGNRPGHVDGAGQARDDERRDGTHARSLSHRRRALRPGRPRSALLGDSLRAACDSTALQLGDDGGRHRPAPARLGVGDVPGDALIERRAGRHRMGIVPGRVHDVGSLVDPASQSVAAPSATPQRRGRISARGPRRGHARRPRRPRPADGAARRGPSAPAGYSVATKNGWPSSSTARTSPARSRAATRSGPLSSRAA